MVAYNFKPRFAEPIASGAKTHTIRRNGKRRHARKGEPVQLYTGLRTKAAAKILQPDPICIDVLPITIVVGRDSFRGITIGGCAVKCLDKFARQDGFKDAAEMHAFFLKMHGVGTFKGSLIEWRQQDVKPSPPAPLPQAGEGSVAPDDFVEECLDCGGDGCDDEGFPCHCDEGILL